MSKNLTADHVDLDSTHIASMVLTSVKANPFVPIKSLIAEIKNLHGYTITYRKAWLGKQKTLALAFGDWEQSYNDLPRWLEVVKKAIWGQLCSILLLLVWLMVFKIILVTRWIAWFGLSSLVSMVSIFASPKYKLMGHF